VTKKNYKTAPATTSDTKIDKIYTRARDCKLKEDASVGFRVVTYKDTHFFSQFSQGQSPSVFFLHILTFKDFAFGGLFLEFLVVEKKEMLKDFSLDM
jgi:hypothetical protein